MDRFVVFTAVAFFVGISASVGACYVYAAYRHAQDDMTVGNLWTAKHNLNAADPTRDPQTGEQLRDGWGNPIRFARPGPVHTRGWDLWSCGPNGLDEQCQGDDLLVGEDVAAVGSR